MKVVFAFATLLALIVVVSCPAADDDKWVTIAGQIVLAKGEKLPVAKEIESTWDKVCKTKEPQTRGIRNVFVRIGPIPVGECRNPQVGELHPTFTVHNTFLRGSTDSSRKE